MGEEISNKILRYLSKKRQESRKNNTTKDVTRTEMLKDLGLAGAELDYHISYLAERYLVYVQVPMPHLLWTHAHITSSGASQAEKPPRA